MKGVARWSADELLNAFGSQADRDPQVELAATTFELASINQYPDIDSKFIRQWLSTKTDVTVRSGNLYRRRLYRPLDDPYEIRVLELKPGVKGEPLEGSLHHCSLEFEHEERPVLDKDGDILSRTLTEKLQTHYALSMDDPTKPVLYTALSYTWGAQVFEGVIECNGYSKAITKSLEAALQRFRKEDRSVVMWVDQICIDQENNVEKEQQIPLMGKIYQHAWNTVIWMGDSSPGSNSALWLLEECSVLLQMRMNDLDPKDFERLGLPTPDSQMWLALCAFLSRAWFVRLWIIQEVILSTNLFVACGDSVTTWRILSTGAEHLVTCGVSRWLQQLWDDSNASEDRDICEAVTGIDYAKSYYQTHRKGTSLFDLLVFTRHAKCYDSRDKIYGLLAMCGEKDRNAVRTSYAGDFTPAELYRDVIVHYLARDSGGLGLTTVLSSVDHESLDLPSWVPDWRKSRETVSLGHSTSGQSIYNPNGRFLTRIGKSDCSYNLQMPNELLVHGIHVDTIATISDIFHGPHLSFTNPSLNTTLLHFYHVASQLQQYPGSNTVFTAFCHTFVAGKDDSGRAKCPSSFEEIISLLLDASTGVSPSLPGQTYSTRQLRPSGRGKLELSSLATRAAGKTFQDVRTAMKAVVKNRRLGITEKGYLGLFPNRVREGHKVYVLDGCHVPFLMRQVDGQEKMRLVGECYVHGIMDGEAVAGDDICMDDVILV